MVRITEELLRKRAEHNEHMLSTLEEVALHQQSIEAIDPLLARLCPRLRILLLQNNLIGRLQHLHRLKELRYLNVAVNNVTKVQNLRRCEALAKLDLTVNFVPKAGLLSLGPALAGNHALRELFLTGNPCADWPGYRQFVVATLPQLARLDGQAITPSERIAAAQALPELHARLLRELADEGVDAAAAARVEDDGAAAAAAADELGALGPDAEVEETGYVDEASGELRRPWCPATRILEHREMQRGNRDAEEARAKGQRDDPLAPPPAPPPAPPRLDDFPPLSEEEEGGRVMQRNEGRWEFSLDESDDGAALVLEVAVGRFLDTSLIKADVRPRVARLLIKGRLLQLVLPAEVRPDASAAQRSAATGRLVLTMPKEDPGARVTDVAHLRPKAAAAAAARGGGSLAKPRPTAVAPLRRATIIAAAPPSACAAASKAATAAAADDDDDDVPDL